MVDWIIFWSVGEFSSLFHCSLTEWVVRNHEEERAHPLDAVLDAAAQPSPVYIDNDNPVGSEDHCLELDIYIAEGVTNAKTVLMYIHGGALDYGA